MRGPLSPTPFATDSLDTGAPGSFQVGTALMQDAVPASAVAIGDGSGKVALFANWFKEGREESLIIRQDKVLTYLRRSGASATGWEQKPLKTAAGANLTADAVAVAVHPNGDVWAFVLPPVSATPQPLSALRLVQTSSDPRDVQCDWLDDTAAAFPSAPRWQILGGVSYSPNAGPIVFGGVNQATSSQSWVQTIHPNVIVFGGVTTAWSPGVPLKHPLAAGIPVGAAFRGHVAAHDASMIVAYYVQQDQRLMRFDQTLVEGSDTPLAGFTPRDSPVQTITCFADGTWNTAAPAAGFSPTDSLAAVAQAVCALPAVPGSASEGTSEGTDAAAAGVMMAAVVDGGVYIGIARGGERMAWREVAAVGPQEPTWGGAVSVAVACDAKGSVQLIAVGRDKGLYETTAELDRGGWFGDWGPVPALSGNGGFTSTGEAAVCVMHDGQFALASYAPDATLYVALRRPGSPWQSWFPVRGLRKARTFQGTNIAVSGFTSDGLFLLATPAGQTATHAILYGMEPDWTPVPGTAGLRELACSLAPSGKFDLVGVGSGDSVLYHCVGNVDGGTYTGWQPVRVKPGGVPFQVSAPAIVAAPDGTARVFAQTTGAQNVVAYDVKQFCGTWMVPDLPHSTIQGDVGCVYLNDLGDVVGAYLSPPSTAPKSPANLVGVSVGGPRFAQARAWQDADGMLHVFGRDEQDVLRAVHQTGWQGFSPNTTKLVTLLPTWSQAKTETTDAKPTGSRTVMATGLRAGVLDFHIDPYPDFKPSELVRTSASPAEAFSILSQDLHSTAWTDDRVRLPDTGAPHVITRYVADVTLLDTQGAGIPGRAITVSAEELAELRVNGVSFLVGPGKDAVAATDPRGRVTISADADSLVAPKVTVATHGLASGTAIDLAAGVNNYLAGKGSLPSQKGLLTPQALKDAKATDDTTKQATPLVPDSVWTPHLQPQTVVDHCATVYSMVDGRPKMPKVLFPGAAEAEPVLAYVIQTWDPERPRFQAFRTRSEVAEYHERRAAHPDFGGVWDDFSNWAGDVWEGVKTGATQIAEVFVDTVVQILVRVGGALVSLGEMIIDSVTQAAHAVEATFTMIAESVVRVVDWLKSLFAFDDVWDTKTALESAIRQIGPWLAPTLVRYQGLSAGWFELQQAKLDDAFDGLRALFDESRVADLGTHVAPLADASGQPVDAASMQSDPQANWMMDQFTGVSATAAHAAGGYAAMPLPAAADPVIDAFQKLLTDLTTSGVFDRVATAFSGVTDAVQASLSDSASSPLIPLLDALHGIATAILQIADLAVRAVFTCGIAVAGHLVDLLFTPLAELGFLNPLYHWVQEQAGVREDAVEDASPGGMLLLGFGFVQTVLYKAFMGVDNAPFPGGVFPTIPAPPWHADAAGAAGDDDPAHCNRVKLDIQLAFNLFNFIASPAVGVVTDWNYDLLDTPGGIIARWGSVLAPLVGNVGLTTPFLLGDEALPEGLMTVIWVLWILFTLCQLGAVLTARSSLKNVGAMVTGTKITTLFGVVILGFTICYLAYNPTDWVTSLAAVAVCLPLVDQFTRPAIQGYIVPVNLGLNLAAVTGPTIVGILETAGGPKVTSTSLPTGQVGMAYDSYLRGKNEARVIRIATWELRGGTGLAPGLKLDTATGRVKGTPAAMTDKPLSFTVRCTDTFSPPQYSADATCTIEVTGTPVGSLSVGTAPGSLPASTIGLHDVLVATVRDKTGALLEGATVRFSAPSQGPTGTFPSGTASADFRVATDTIDVTTGADGKARTYFAAGGATGTCVITAAVPGVRTAAGTFTVTITPSQVATVGPAATSTPQRTHIGQIGGQDFFNQIIATVTDASGHWVPNVVVEFTAQADDAQHTYGVFATGEGKKVTAVTDEEGRANAGIFSGRTASTTNPSEQQFPVELQAAVAGSSAPAAVFSLTYLTRWN